MDTVYNRIKQLEESNENNLSELWNAVKEINRLKVMNHQCLNLIDQQKMERKQLMTIIEDLTLQIGLLQCKL
jgi:hypothetical protein